MSLCIATAAVAMSLAVQSFTLSWIHSVERTEWQETWRVEGSRLVLEEARVRGSGAGMDPGEGAVLRDGWWVWPGHMAPVAGLRLAVSGATGTGWRWCADALGCRDLETWLIRSGKTPEMIGLQATTPDACKPL